MRLPQHFFQTLSYISLCVAYSLYGSEKESSRILSVSHASGSCFLQPLSSTELPPRKLSLSKQINEERPFALGTSRDSLLEIKSSDESGFSFIRIGNESALELQDHHQLLHKGAILFSHRHTKFWKFIILDSLTEMRGRGTWMMERLSSGLKVILLEGKLSIGNSIQKQELSSGELVIISSANPKGTKPIKVDLPLLLGTSRLINGFPTTLPSNSRLFSAAQVQALKLKKKYDALVGDVTEEKKLQLWTVPKK